MTTLDPAALRQHLEQLPPLIDDPAYLVFADWLQAQGHPWGELIVLHHRAAHAATAEECGELLLAAELLLEERGSAILGELPHRATDLAWHLGFVRRARLPTPVGPNHVLTAVQTLLAAPAARMLQGLVLDPRPDRFDTTRDWGRSRENIIDPWPDWDDLGPLFHERIPHLGFGGWPASAASAYVRMPSFDSLSRWLRTTVRKLELTGSAPTARAPLDLPTLLELHVRYADAAAADLDALAASKLPALEELSLSLGGSSHCILDDVHPPAEYDAEDEDQERYPAHFSDEDLASLDVHGVEMDLPGEALRRLLDALPPGVIDFGLPSSALNAELLGVLVRHPRIARLHHLDLSACAIGDDIAQLLLDAHTPLAKIGEIDLSRNQLTPRFTGRLGAALPNAITGEQGRGEPDFFMRYVATME
jgi:uncharacterized protein (TIGR02996 family)